MFGPPKISQPQRLAEVYAQGVAWYSWRHQNSGVAPLYAGGAHQDDLKLTTHGRQLAGHLLDIYFVLDVSLWVKPVHWSLYRWPASNRPVLATRTYARSLAENVGEKQCDTPYSMVIPMQSYAL